MATFTFTTTPKQDAAVQYVTQQFNERLHPPTPLTAMQFAQRAIEELLDGWVTRAESEQGQTKAELYQRATPEDRATIDAILAKYSG